MKIVLISIGTRGDMEPFLAIGELLREKGHQVVCAFPEQFRDLAEDSNLDFFSLGSEFINLLDGDLAKSVMGGSGSSFKKFIAYVKLGIDSKKVNKELIFKQSELVEKECPDRIVHNGKAIYPIIWGLENKGQPTLISPVPYLHYVRDHSHVVFNSNFGAVLNRLTYWLADFGLITTIQISIKWLKIKAKIQRKEIKTALQSNKVIYTISPALFPRPDEWKENLNVLGYHERYKSTNWEPEKDLIDFLERHKRVVFITFGSMVNPEPEKKTNILLDLLEKNNFPAIINTASGGLVKPDTYNTEQIYFVSQIPYDWIFPRVYAVIHHGGSGTTHLGLKYGCPTLIIPHIIDQFVWKRIVYQLAIGPKGVKIGNISIRNLEPKILDLLNNHLYKKNAELIANQMQKENFTERLYRMIID